MTQHILTNEERLAEIRQLVERNFHDPFGPYRMPNNTFTCDELDPIQPYDLERAKNPEFQWRMRHSLKEEGMNVGRVARRLGIDARLVAQEAQKMRVESGEEQIASDRLTDADYARLIGVAA